MIDIDDIQVDLHFDFYYGDIDGLGEPNLYCCSYYGLKSNRLCLEDMCVQISRKVYYIAQNQEFAKNRHRSKGVSTLLSYSYNQRTIQISIDWIYIFDREEFAKSLFKGIIAELVKHSSLFINARKSFMGKYNLHIQTAFESFPNNLFFIQKLIDLFLPFCKVITKCIELDKLISYERDLLLSDLNEMLDSLQFERRYVVNELGKITQLVKNHEENGIPIAAVTLNDMRPNILNLYKQGVIDNISENEMRSLRKYLAKAYSTSKNHTEMSIYLEQVKEKYQELFFLHTKLVDGLLRL